MLPHYPPSAMRSCGRPTHASAAFECARSIQTATSWQIEYDLAVLLKHLSPEDLSEKISWVSLAPGMWFTLTTPLNDTSAAQFAHLEQLPVHVSS